MSSLVGYLVIAALIGSSTMWIGCQFDPYAGEYLTYRPRIEDICGVWSVDAKKTTWIEGCALLRSGELDVTSAYLELKPDNTLTFHGLPAFWDAYEHVVTPRRSGVGKWTVDQDQDGVWHLSLWFETLNGGDVKRGSALANFRKAKADYLLHFIIFDPDSGEAFVLKKGDASRVRRVETIGDSADSDSGDR